MNQERVFHLDEIDIISIIKDLLRNIWLMILIAISAFLLVTSAYKLTYTPQYTTNAILAVNSKGSQSAFSSLQLTTQMASVFSEVFKSDVLKRSIAQELGISESELEGSLNASIISETNLIMLTATAGNSKQAYQMMTAALNNYDTVSDYLFSNAVLRVLKAPVVPYAPSNIINIRKYQLLAMLGAIALLCAGIVALSVFRFTVKTVEGGERQLDGKLLGTIPFEHKKMFQGAKKKQAPLISTSLTSLYFKEAVRKVCTRIDYHLLHHQNKTIIVASVAENEGKSCVASNLAIAMAEKNKKVLLIDMDLKKPAQFKIHNYPEKPNIWVSDLFTDMKLLEDAIYYEKDTNAYYLFQKEATRGANKMAGSDNFRKLLHLCKESFDVIIIDTPPMALASTAEAMLNDIDSVLLVVRQDRTDIRAINDAVDAIKKTKADFAGFVLNAFHTTWTSSSHNSYGKNY